jgi:hypothetical protein
MADSATVGILKTMLTMDTSSYDAGAKKAASGAASVKATLGNLKDEVQKLTPLAERMVKGFGGDKLLYSANSLTTAVTKLGGAQRLTEGEQSRVNATLTKAIDKYKALGQEAPKAMVDLEKATRKAGDGTNFLTTKMVALGAFLGTFAAQIAGQAIRGVINMGKEAFQSAGTILDLADATGLSTRTIQQMQFVAGQTGKSLDNFTNAAFKLGTTIAGGGNSVVDALKKLGIEHEKIRGLRMDQQWDMVAKALSRVESEGERNRIGMTLMGRGFKDVAAAIAQGYDEMARKAKTSTDAQLKELDRLNDEWDAFKRNMTTTFGAEMGRLAQEWRITKEVNEEAAAAIKAGRGLDLPFGLTQADIKEEVQRRIRNAAIEDIQLTAQQVKANEDYVRQLREASAELKKLDATERAQIAAAQKLGTVTDEELAQALVHYGVEADKAATVLRLLNGEMKESESASKKLAKSQEHLAEMFAKFSGAKALETARDYERTLRAVGDTSKLTRDEQEEMARAFSAVIEKYQQAGPSGAAIVAHFEALLRVVQPTIPAINGFNAALTAMPPAIEAAAMSIDARLLPALSGVNALIDSSKRLRELNDVLGGLLMLPPGIVENQEVSVDIKPAIREQQWRDFHDSLQAMFSGLIGSSTSGLFSMVTGLGFGRGDADEAEREYERLRRSGTASAEAITDAFHRMKDEQNGFLERFKGWTGNILREFGRLIDELLGMWIREFLGGLVSSLARATFGKAAGNWISSALGLAPGIAGGAIGGAGVLASTAVPASLAMAAVPGAAVAGTAATAAATTATATGTAAGATAGGVLATVGGIAAAFALPFAAAFLGGFFGKSTPMTPEKRERWVQRGWLPSIAEVEAVKGRTSLGGFTAPDVSMPSRLSGLSMPTDSTTQGRADIAGARTLHQTIEIKAFDTKGIREFFRSREYTDTLGFIFENNDGFVTSRLGRALRP